MGLDPVDQPDDLGLELGEGARAAPVLRRVRPAGTQRGIGLEERDRELATLHPQIVDQGLEDRDEGVGLLGRKEFHAMRRLVIVTGLSSAGKSQAMKSFEDFGFACLDNAPPVLARRFVALSEEAGYANVALAPDVRTLGDRKSVV